MDQTKNRPAPDITTAPYKGPSSVVASLGNAAVQAKFLTIGGFLVGALAAFAAPETSARIVGKIRTSLSQAGGSENAFKRFGGKIGNTVLDFGQHTADLLMNIGVVKTGLGKLSPAKVKAAADGAIITSGIASIFGLFTGGGTGIQSVQRAKRQVKELQTEVVKLRDTNADLREKLIDAQTAAADAKTGMAAKKGILKVAPDTLPTMADEAPSGLANAISKPAGSWSDTIQQQKSANSEAALV